MAKTRKKTTKKEPVKTHSFGDVVEVTFPPTGGRRRIAYKFSPVHGPYTIVDDNTIDWFVDGREMRITESGYQLVLNAITTENDDG